MKTFGQIVQEWDEGPNAPNLSTEERIWLQQALQPGSPLNKVMKSLFDFAQHLKDHVAAQPLVGPEEIQLARQYQLQREAALNLLKWFVQQAQPQPEKAQKNDPPPFFPS